MRKQFTITACAMMLIALATNAQAQESDFGNADGDSDGKVTVAEFTEYVESRLPGFDQIDAFVNKVDADGNGEISEDEFENRFQVLEKLRNAPADEPMKQEKKSDDKKDAAKQDAAEKDSATVAYNELKKLILASKWKEASQHMTKKARDEFCVEQITKALAMLESDMPMQLPGLDEMLDDLEDAFDKHNLDDIDIKVGEMFKMEWKMDMGDDDAEDDEFSDKKKSDEKKKEKAEKEQKKLADQARKRQQVNTTKILEALDKDGKRWEIIADVWKAQQKSPFAMSMITGEVEKEEIEDNKVFLKIKMVPPARDGDDDQPGVIMQIVSPPMYIQMEKSDGKWKYAGRDQKRTEEAMKEFMKNQRGRFGGRGDRADF